MFIKFTRSTNDAEVAVQAMSVREVYSINGSTVIKFDDSHSVGVREPFEDVIMRLNSASPRY